MANHQSALKRIRQIKTRRVENRYHARTMRNAIKDFRELTSKEEALEKLPGICAIIDKNAKRAVIHKNKAANLKSKLVKHANSL